jgi:hypothetical protein
MPNTYSNCLDSSSHMHRACPRALGSHAPSDHQFAGDKPNCGSDGYPEKRAAAPRNEQQTKLISQR